MLRTHWTLRLLVAAGVWAAANPEIVSAQDDTGNDPEWRLFVKDGDEQFAAGDYLSAERAYRKAFEEAKKFGKSDVRLGFSAVKYGNVRFRLDRFDDARKLYMLAIPIFQELQDDGLQQLAWAHRQLAELDFWQGRLPESIKGYQYAIKICDLLDNIDPAMRVECLFGLARDFRYANQPDTAEPILAEALRRLDQIEQPVDREATIRAEMGHILRLKGDWRKAHDVFLSAARLAIQQHGEEHRETAEIYEGLSLVLKHLGHHDDARAYATRAEKIYAAAH